MKNKIYSGAFFFILIILATNWLSIEAQKCKPSGNIKGKRPPRGQCNKGNHSEYCKKGQLYPIFKCSPQVSKQMKATLTINNFQKGGDRGSPSACDNKYHLDKTPIVALSTRWFDKKRWCLGHITIHGNGRSVKAMVVDECDSTIGCDAKHDYQPPCPNNIVDASKAVWKALGVSGSDPKWGFMDIFWSDA